MLRSTVLLAAVLTAAPALAIVVPNDREATPGTGTFLGPLSNAQRTYQLLVDDTQLSSVVGQQIVGVRFRLISGASANYPTADITYGTFDLRLSESVEPSARSLTFANNVVGAQTLVRSGPMTITAGSYQATSPPHPFGPTINFDIPYTYNGGNLLLELRSSGHSGTSSSTDAMLTSSAGYGTLFSAAWTGNVAGTAGAQGNAVVTDFVTVIPEPAALALVLVPAMALRRRR